MVGVRVGGWGRFPEFIFGLDRLLTRAWAIGPGFQNLRFSYAKVGVRLGGAAGPQLDVFVWLGWDTDHTDVDLHVREPSPGYTRWTHCLHCWLPRGCTQALWAWLGAVSGAQPHTSQGRLLGRPHEPWWALPLWTVEPVDPPCVLQAFTEEQKI